jgi:HSP20 family protein
MSHIKVTQKDSIVDDLEQIQQRIAQRAYQLFEGRGSLPGDPCVDWFAAEREMVRRPAIELREQRGVYLVSASVAGIDPDDVRVEVTPQDVVIKAKEEQRTHVQQDGRVHQSEFRAGRIFRSVHFPSAIDTAKVQAEYRNGLLTVKAPIVQGTQAARREIRVA